MKSIQKTINNRLAISISHTKYIERASGGWNNALINSANGNLYIMNSLNGRLTFTVNLYYALNRSLLLNLQLRLESIMPIKKQSKQSI